jgi:predicted alpha/beta superfamily hydrolase
MKKLAAIIFFFYTLPVFGQFPPVTIPGSEIRKISSEIVAGQEYELHILLPGGYRNNTKKYPVVYLMDAQWDFPLLKSIYGQQYYDGFIPELIIVGVTWGGSNPNADSLRVRDYTPTNDGRVQSGGADRFLSFMRNELFPYIENNYRAEANNRSIMGCSLGGLITLYALFTQPDMFNGYAAASPAISWDKNVLDQYEKKYMESNPVLPGRLLMSFGSVERGLPRFQQFSALMKSRNYQGLQVKSVVLENTGHSGTKSETFGRGIQYIFERPRLKLEHAKLEQYKGLYRSENGNAAEIKIEGQGLVFQFTAMNRYLLYASGESAFYSDAEYFNLEFKLESGATNGFQLNRYGSSVFFKKIK